MRVLLLGSGGREHALAIGLAADPSVAELVAAPGNPGIAQLATLREVTATDPAAVAALAVETGADLVVVGPEGPLVVLEEAATGRPVEPPPVLSSAGTPLRPEEVRVVPGPGAGQATRARFGGEASHG